MALEFEAKVKRSPLAQQPESYYAQPVWKNEVNTRRLAKDISEQCTLTEADVVATLSALSAVMEKYLHEGHSVRLDNIGRFRLTLTSEGVSSSEGLTAKQVKVKKICFMADKELKNGLATVEVRKAK